MCTLSILPQSIGFTARMNRDENPSRASSEAEFFAGQTGALAWAYPLDPSSGGTWIGINNQGVLLALLNEYPGGPQGPKSPKSRGGLIPVGLSEKNAMDAIVAIAELLPGGYGACLVIAIGLRGPILALRSDGRDWQQRSYARAPLLFCSSGYDAEGAKRNREPLFQKALAGGEKALAAFHRSHEPEKGPYSVCMHRQGSQSVSFSEVLADKARIELKYWPLSPCEVGTALPATRAFNFKGI